MNCSCLFVSYVCMYVCMYAWFLSLCLYSLYMYVYLRLQICTMQTGLLHHARMSQNLRCIHAQISTPQHSFVVWSPLRSLIWSSSQVNHVVYNFTYMPLPTAGIYCYAVCIVDCLYVHFIANHFILGPLIWHIMVSKFSSPFFLYASICFHFLMHKNWLFSIDC